jgi:serine/threonine protein phosphatase 1
MRTVVIGDIHGNDILFRKALKAVSLKKTDILIVLGDLIDRGPDSRGVLDTIFLLKESGFVNLICIKGNHEQMLIDSYYDENKEYIWLKNGGDYTLKSFRVNFANQIPKKYIELIESFPYYVKKDNMIFVHAGLNLDIDNPFQDFNSMMWTRNMTEEKLNKSAFNHLFIFHGHTPMEEEEIKESFRTKKVKCLDNGVFLTNDGYGSLVIAEIENQKLNFIK